MIHRYPTALARLRQEVLSVVGPHRTPTYEDIREMKFMRAVINETLRLYPIVPFNTRYVHSTTGDDLVDRKHLDIADIERSESIKETVWPSPDPSLPPIYIPAGTE